MKLFRTKNNTIAEIGRDPFKLEKDIQALVEANLETFFELEFVSSEFRVADFRLDTLAFDSQDNSFVIVEYKRGHSYSVVDQGYSYLSTMRNNKADFVLEYNEKADKRLRRNDIDWDSARILFVAPSFNVFQRNSINFENMPFELWEIRRFEDGLVVFEQISGSSKDKDVGPDNRVWTTLRERLESYPDTSLSSTKHYLAWKRSGNTICRIRSRKKYLEIELYSGTTKGRTRSKNFFTLDDPKSLARKHVRVWRSGSKGHSYFINIEKISDMDYAMFLLEQKYNSLE